MENDEICAGCFSDAEFDRTINFNKLLDKKIVDIDCREINVVHFRLDDGSIISIGAEEQHHGIPVVQVEQWDTTDAFRPKVEA